jgi:hypothetical protein
MSDGFGFGVRVTRSRDDWVWDETPDPAYPASGEGHVVEIPVDPPLWTVFLPHRCDAWEIGSGSQQDAIDALERFICEAQETLTALREGREISHPENA